MVSFNSILCLTLSLWAVSTQAIITAISVPNGELHAGKKFIVTIHTEGHIINNDQFYTIFGLLFIPKNVKYGSGVMGDLIGNGYDLVEHKHSETGHGAFNVTLTLPKDFHTETGKRTKYTLTTSTLSTAGIVNGANIIYLTETVYVTPK